MLKCNKASASACPTGSCIIKRHLAFVFYAIRLPYRSMYDLRTFGIRFLRDTTRTRRWPDCLQNVFRTISELYLLPPKRVEVRPRVDDVVPQLAVVLFYFYAKIVGAHVRDVKHSSCHQRV